MIAGITALACAQPAPPHMHYAPDRTYHLVHASATIDVQEERQRATATVVDTISMLRDGALIAHFDVNADKIGTVELDGKPAHYTSSAGSVDVQIPEGLAGAVHKVRVDVEGSFFHWYKPNPAEPQKIGFWGEGMAAIPVSWSYPNDFSTTEIHITLPAAWTAISNGLLTSDTSAGNGRHTVVWKMDMPHAGYLTSLAVGPFDVYRDSWRGKPLIMTCPKGLGGRLASTFGRTKDILDFYSEKLGVPYVWPKYGQSLVYDHPYGEENVSATIYPVYWGTEWFLNDPRDDMYPSDWVEAHETAHQWFGDLVTCKNWGDTWLNEGVTSFMEMMYTLHERGKLESLRELESYSRRYFVDSIRDFRPVATPYYSDSTGMGGWTTYNKGAAVLMSLWMQLGDKTFFSGLHRYLIHHEFGNVESNDLCEDMTDATGINLHPFFDQWIYKPGHPLIDWSWSYDEGTHQVEVKVAQSQDTSRGVPIYDVPTHVGLCSGGVLVRFPIRLNAASQSFFITASSRPEAVLFDPDHEFLRQIKSEPWAGEELPAVFRLAPNPTDKAYALDKLLDVTPSPAILDMIADVLRQDGSAYPAIRDTSKLAGLKRSELHDFWLTETLNPDFQRRAHGATGLAGVQTGPADLAVLHKLLGDDQPYVVVASALRGLASIDFPSVRQLALALAKSSNSPVLRAAALDVLADAREPGWAEAILATASDTTPPVVRRIGLMALRRIDSSDARLTDSLRSALKSDEPMVRSEAARMAGILQIKP
jgi:aminopeptidase N